MTAYATEYRVRGANAATVVGMEGEDDASASLSPADASRMGKAAGHLIAAFGIMATRGALNVAQTNDRWRPYRREANELPPAVLSRLDDLQAAG